MDIVLLSLALTAFVLALFWTVQRLMRILPAWVNLDVIPSYLLLILWRGVVGLGLLSLWIDSLYNMLAADKWTLPFCKNLIWVILIPTLCLYLLNRLLTKNPELPGTMGAETLNELPHAELPTRVRELADDGQKLEA